MKKTLRKIIATLTITSFSATLSYAQVNDCRLPEQLTPQICQLMQTKETLIHRKKNRLHQLEEIQGHLIRGKRIKNKIEAGLERDLTDEELLTNEIALVFQKDETLVPIADALRPRLLEPEDSLELLRVEEQILEEIAEVSENDSIQIQKGMASIGSLIASSVMIAFMNKSLKGLTLKQKLIGTLLPKQNKLFRLAVNSAAVISIVITGISAYRIYENNKEKTTLKEMIELLSEVKDQADTIAQVREELEYLEACFWLQVDQLERQGFASLVDNSLQCQ